MRGMRWRAIAASAAGLLVVASSGLPAQAAEQDEKKVTEEEADPRKVVEAYEARMNRTRAQSLAPGRRGPRARVEWKRQQNGERILEVRIRDVTGFYPGRDRWEMDLVINGRTVQEIQIRQGQGRLKLETRRGARVPAITNGDQVELRWRGEQVMHGVFRSR